MPYVILARALAFQPTVPGEPHIPSGPEEIVPRGSFVPDYVPTGTVNALSAAGQIVWADVPDPAVIPFGSDPAQFRSPEQPPVLPSDPNGQSPVLADIVTGGDNSGAVQVDVPPANEPDPTRRLPDLPKTADSKETWENYAQLPAIGLTAGEAEAMNKTDLMAEVKQRYAVATA